MEQTNNAQPKHIKSFWAIVIIATVAVIAGGLIYWVKFQLNNEEELNSIGLSAQQRFGTSIQSHNAAAATTTQKK
jgi:hypothetical protein